MYQRTSNSGMLSHCKNTCKRQMSRSSNKWGRRIITIALLLLVLQFSKLAFYKLWRSETDHTTAIKDTADVRNGRKLLSVEPDVGSGSNETEDGGHGAVWERCDFEKAHSQYAFLPLYVFLVFLLFIAIAIICDDFFVPSLEAISEKLDLSEDVAGATFMAAGSSAPELFTSVAGVGVDSDVGVGTIVGSAMFNILVIVALSAMLAGKTINLDWRPLFRDALVYGLSIACLIGFAWDAKFQWWEALILLLGYIAYIVIMKFNKHLLRLLEKVECFWCRNESRIEPVEESKSSSSAAEKVSSIHSLPEEHRHRFVHSHRGELAGSIANRRRSTSHSLDTHQSQSSAHTGTTHHSSKHHLGKLPLPHIEPAAAHTHQKKASQEEIKMEKSTESNNPSNASESSSNEEEAVLVLIPFLPPIRSTPPDLQLAREEGKIGVVKYILKWILFIVSFPFIVAFTWTIPNCSENRKWYVVTFSFVMSIVWIGIISFLMVTLVARAGCILDIDQFTMGLVVIAVGTSVPDCLSSVLVARDGFGDMAVSNAIGSNVFDINLGLGLPFLLGIAIQKGEPFLLLSDSEMVLFENGEYAISPHSKFGFLLLFILLIFVCTLTVFRFRLNKWTAICFLVFYVLFLLYSFIQELVPYCDQGINC